MLETVLLLIMWAVRAGGGIWLVWGAIVLAGGLKEQHGPQIQGGIWQMVGGGVIIAAAQLLELIETTPPGA